MAARNQAKAMAAIAELRRDTGRDAIYLHLDLADLASVKAAALEILRYAPSPRDRTSSAGELTRGARAAKSPS